VIPVLICAVLFVWASRVFFRYRVAPPGAIEVFVVGKQWMWTLQHPEGAREINELHIPVGVPIKLTMASQDVIHDFFVPAFRQKMDVVPGRYTTEWFEATKTGTYHFFCSQYCGTSHSAMVGWVDVMEPEDYSAWLRANSTKASVGQAGERLFAQFGCAGCHGPNGNGSGPSLQGIFGKPATLASGASRTVDEGFIHQMIVNPTSLPIAGYPQIMPTFEGQLDEEQIMDLVAYVKSLGETQAGAMP
jgi:cytochrome c oxidase subunit II